MNYVDYEKYEKHLITAAGVYNIPKGNVDALQNRFLLTLGILAGLVFMSSLMGMVSAETLGVTVFGLITIIFLVLQLFTLVPYAISVIRLSLKQKDESGFVESLGSSTGWVILQVLGLLMIFGIIVMLPYGLAGYLEEQGSTSNIFVSFKVLLMVLAIAVILFLITRIIGSIVAAASGKDVSLGQMFAKSNGHMLSILLIMVITLVPLEFLAMFLNYCLAGLLKISEAGFMQVIVFLLQAFVRASILLMQLYLFFTALALYMKNNRLIA